MTFPANAFIGTNLDDVIRWAAGQPRTVAVVGLSSKPDRPSHGVAKALQAMGYRIVPVNPAYDEVLGLTSYPTSRACPVPSTWWLRSAGRSTPAHRTASRCGEGRLGLRALWLQEGVVNEEAARIALEAGIAVVMDRCLYKDAVRLRR